MTGLFLASLWLSAAIVGTTLLSNDVEPAHTPATPFGSLRFWVLCSLGFGLAGLSLALVAVGPLLQVVAAGAVGTVLGRAMWPVFADSSADVTLYRLAGEEGRVLVPVDPATGKIVIDTGASRVELPARTGDGSRLAVGQRVLVAFVENGVACVIGY